MDHTSKNTEHQYKIDALAQSTHSDYNDLTIGISIFDVWLLTFDSWHFTLELWHLTSDLWHLTFELTYWWCQNLYFECTVTGIYGTCTGTDDTGMMVLALVLKVLTALALMVMILAQYYLIFTDGFWGYLQFWKKGLTHSGTQLV